MDDRDRSKQNRHVVETMWRALAEMDWETMKACMHPDIFYEDIPSDDPGAHGPDNCVKRLQIAFRHLQKQEQHTRSLVAEGDVVVVEHSEKWTFKTGETAEHSFCTVHQITDGLVSRWSDYWDVNKFASQFPAWFVEEMMKASAEEFGG